MILCRSTTGSTKIPVVAIMAEVRQVGPYSGCTTGYIALEFILSNGEQATGPRAPGPALPAARPTAGSTQRPGHRLPCPNKPDTGPHLGSKQSRLLTEQRHYGDVLHRSQSLTILGGDTTSQAGGAAVHAEVEELCVGQHLLVQWDHPFKAEMGHHPVHNERLFFTCRQMQPVPLLGEGSPCTLLSG